VPERQPLDENVFPRLAVRINEGLRKHPDIGRGAGITALISFVDILTALKTLEGHVSSRSLVTAALTAFPHRIKARTLESTDQAVKEVLYQTLAEYGMDVDKVTLDLLGMVNEKDETPSKESLLENLPLGDEVEKGKTSLISVDPQEMLQLFEEQGEGGTTPSILDVLLGLLAGRSGEGRPGGGGFIRVTPEFLERLQELGILGKDSRLDVYTVKFDSSDPRKLLEIRRLFEEHLDQLLKVGSEEVLDRVFSKEGLQGLLQELDTLLQLQARGGRREDLATSFLFQRSNFPIINHILQEWLKRRHGSVGSNEWLERVAVREELKNLLDLLKLGGELEEKEGELKLTKESYRLILEKVLPEIEAFVMLWLRPRLGQGEEEDIVDVRRYRVGDRYRDISARATLRHLVRRSRQEPSREDFIVNQKEPRKPLDIIFVVDSSMSMGSDGKLDEAKKTVIGLSLAAAAKNDRVGVVAFSDGAEEVIALTEDVEGSVEKVLGLRPLESTNIEEALHLSGEIFLRDHSPHQKHVILVTDGEPTSYTLKGKENDSEASKYGYYSPTFSRMTALREAKALRTRGITISTVCIAKYDFGERRFCEKLAKVGNGRTYTVRSSKDLLRATLQEYSKIQQS
jgi:Mg-chelatase subunit ChlD